MRASLFVFKAIAAVQASQFQFPVQWPISRREGGERVLKLRAILKKEIAHHPTTQGEGGCKGAAEHSRIQHQAFARRSAGERERGRQGQREAGSLKSAWQGFLHVADEFEYICLSGLHWSACAAIFEKLRC